MTIHFTLWTLKRNRNGGVKAIWAIYLRPISFKLKVFTGFNPKNKKIESLGNVGSTDV